MGRVGTGHRSNRSCKRALPVIVAAGALAMALVLALAACGGGGETTTTMAGQIEDTTTTGLPGELTTITEPAGEDTTTSTAVEGEDTTTTSGAAAGTTTTEKLSTAEERLPNGHIRAMGFIDKVYGKDGKRYISIDYAEMLTGQTALDAARKAGDIGPDEDLPNDYYIRNTNTAKRDFEVSQSVDVTTSTWNGEQDMAITWEEFIAFWSATPPDGAEYLRDSPWWIERDGQTVVKIDEQYLP